MLSLGQLLNATVSFPEPCESLSLGHSPRLPQCGVGWRLYLSLDTSFDGYVGSRQNRVRECSNAGVLDIQSLADANDTAFLSRPHFCLIAFRSTWFYDQAFDAWLNALCTKLGRPELAYKGFASDYMWTKASSPPCCRLKQGIRQGNRYDG